MTNTTKNTKSKEVIHLLKTIQQEIDEYLEYIVDCEEAELSDYQQKKITEPLEFYIQKLEVDMTHEKLTKSKKEIR